MSGMLLHGFKAADWEAAKHEAWTVLIKIAAKSDVITYSSLVQQIKSIRIEAHDMRLPLLLEEISVSEDKAGRGLLSVIVVHKNGDLMPGDGFFRMAKECGRKARSKELLWDKELKYVYKQWGKK